MKTLMKFICAAFSVLILAMGAGAANGGPLPTPRPRPTPAPRPTPPLTADISSSYNNSKVPYSVDGGAILTAFGNPQNYQPAGIAYGDFNGDGIPDVVFAPVNGTTTGTPIVIALGQPGGGYIDAPQQVISGEVPEPVGARKILVADFNGDGWPDIFIVDFGLDAPPLPGSHNWLLLSDGTGHLVYQSAFIDLVGNHHTATAGDIDHSGHIDIFVENQDPTTGLHYFLVNDGQGHFTIDTTRVPSSLNPGYGQAFWSSELIDVDNDGNLDLVVGEVDDPNNSSAVPLEIFWGNGTGFYSDANKTVLPAELQFSVMLDIDCEDINHDGRRDLVITRTDLFYTGFYFQVVMQTSPRVFADESLPRLIHDRGTWIGNNARWVVWIRWIDMNAEGAPDIVIDEAGPDRQLGWANDGNGYFTFTGGWLKGIWTNRKS